MEEVILIICFHISQCVLQWSQHKSSDCFCQADSFCFITGYSAVIYFLT